MNLQKWSIVPALAVALVATSGCATKKYVRQETQSVSGRVDEVQTQVEDTQTRLRATDKRLDATNQQVGEVSQTAQEALQRAMEAGKLAEGKLLYETVLTDDKVRFGFNRAELSEEARAAIDELAGQLKQENAGIYVEIQGHTDNVGSEDYNEQLGLSRAEAVRRYLNQEHQFPLHRINVISYGESAAIDNNTTREGRAHNRRVALIVLR
jgi:outer membrane protein OmpA-like peptidoglycan-associated protein